MVMRMVMRYTRLDGRSGPSGLRGYKPWPSPQVATHSMRGRCSGAGMGASGAHLQEQEADVDAALVDRVVTRRLERAREPCEDRALLADAAAAREWAR